MDIDIDCADRTTVLKLFMKTVDASKIDDDEISKHGVGVYFQNIPIDPISNLASIPYENAQNKGYYKFDFLNMHVYSLFKNREDMKSYMNKPIMWSFLTNKEILKNLVHLNSDHASKICVAYKPASIEELAIVIALIRPAKKHLVGKSFDEIRSDIWKKEKDYYFKKSHAISYAHVIVLQLNYYAYGGV